MLTQKCIYLHYKMDRNIQYLYSTIYVLDKWARKVKLEWRCLNNIFKDRQQELMDVTFFSMQLYPHSCSPATPPTPTFQTPLAKCEPEYRSGQLLLASCVRLLAIHLFTLHCLCLLFGKKYFLSKYLFVFQHTFFYYYFTAH